MKPHSLSIGYAESVMRVFLMCSIIARRFKSTLYFFTGSPRRLQNDRWQSDSVHSSFQCAFQQATWLVSSFRRANLKYRIARNTRQLLTWANFLSREFLSRIDDYTEDMVTFTALVKIYSSEYFCNARVAGIGEIFIQWKFWLYGISKGL